MGFVEEMLKGLTRRDFIKGTAAGAVGGSDGGCGRDGACGVEGGAEARAAGQGDAA